MRTTAAGIFAVSVALAGVAAPAFAQKSGGILNFYHRGNPPSGSIHEEATNSTTNPYMSVFNNLVMFDQAKRIEGMDTIVPELATEWAWDDSRTKLTFKLRTGVKWHDGKPFTAKDVKCTFDLLQGKSKDRLRKNPRAIWYHNLKEVKINGDTEVTFTLGRPQPAFLMLLAAGFTPMYPCHVSAQVMRTNPIGTGPFKFVEFKRNEYIKFTKNKDYWKKGLPYLDGHEWRVVTNRSTRILAFSNGDFDITFPTDVTVPLMKDVKNRAPDAVCDMTSTGVSTNLIVNRDEAPFNDAKIREAMALALDRQSFIDILTEGKAQIGGAMMPPPDGRWGLGAAELKDQPGYGPDIEGNRAKARKIMEGLGYSQTNPLKVKISTRNIAVYRDPAVILIDQLKKIHIAGELDVVDTSIWHAKVARKDYAIGLNLTGVGVDDPDVNYYENYKCGSQRNYTKYCNPELEKLFDKQSMEGDATRRKVIVDQIEKILIRDVARPIIFHGVAATCWHPYVKGVQLHVNSIYNDWRMEGIWLDK
ncbi:MAG: ABC transporter substrate-binding protein [Hyphomicrobiaceae bacterium]